MERRFRPPSRKNGSCRSICFPRSLDREHQDREDLLVRTCPPSLPAAWCSCRPSTFRQNGCSTFRSKSGFNTATTFNRFLTYPGGSRDFFGFDDGTRCHPVDHPYATSVCSRAPSRPPELQIFGQSFADNWEPTPIDSVRPQVDWSAVGGGTFGPLGIGRRPHFQQQARNFRANCSATSGRAAVPRHLYRVSGLPRLHREGAAWGSLQRGACGLSPNHKTHVPQYAYPRHREDRPRVFRYDGGVDSSIDSQRLRYIEATLFATGVEGDHSFRFPQQPDSLAVHLFQVQPRRAGSCAK